MQSLFKAKSVKFIVSFNDSQTAREIIARLPLESTISTWGDEIYFDIGFKASPQGATMEVSAGDVAYWSQGKCLCVFFGPTPESTSQQPVPASPVVIVGTTDADPAELKTIELGETIVVEAA